MQILKYHYYKILFTLAVEVQLQTYNKKTQDSFSCTINLRLLEVSQMLMHTHEHKVEENDMWKVNFLHSLQM